MILLLTAGTGQQGRGWLAIGAGEEGSRHVPGCCREEPGGPYGAVLQPSPVGSSGGRGAAGAARPRCGSGGAGNVRPGGSWGAAEDAALAVCAYGQSRGL